jgi:DNA-binding MarR family transcriptional regulator
MKPFDASTKAAPRPQTPSEPTPDSCASLLLETAPRLLRAVRLAIADGESPVISLPQFRTLFFIQAHPGVSLSETAEFLELTLPSASKLVDQLVRRGMLARLDALDDRRKITLRITPRGDALLKNAQAHVRRHLAGLLSHLGHSELAALHCTLGLLQNYLPAHRFPENPRKADDGNGHQYPSRAARPALKAAPLRDSTS